VGTAKILHLFGLTTSFNSWLAIVTFAYHDNSHHLNLTSTKKKALGFIKRIQSNTV